MSHEAASRLLTKLRERQTGSISDLFHENSKITPHRAGAVTGESVLAVGDKGFKPYVSAPRTPIGDDLLPLTRSLMDSLDSRRSVREFSREPLRRQEIATCICYACGIRSGFHRYIPSAGALFPLEVYLIALDVVGLNSGVYHYDPKTNTLERVDPVIDRTILAEATFQESVAQTASAVLVITAVFGRSKLKYGERGYRFCLMEAGHLAQNVCLVTAALGLACCPIGGFIDDVINQALLIDSFDEAAVYLLALGGHATS